MLELVDKLNMAHPKQTKRWHFKMNYSNNKMVTKILTKNRNEREYQAREKKMQYVCNGLTIDSTIKQEILIQLERVAVFMDIRGPPSSNTFVGKKYFVIMSTTLYLKMRVVLPRNENYARTHFHNYIA